MAVKTVSRKNWVGEKFRMWLRTLDSSELIRLYHTDMEDWEAESRAYFADELLRRGFNW